MKFALRYVRYSMLILHSMETTGVFGRPASDIYICIACKVEVCSKHANTHKQFGPDNIIYTNKFPISSHCA